VSIVYLDTSAFMRACIANAPDHEAALAVLNRGFELASSELLWLEADRTAIRLAAEDPGLAELPARVAEALSVIEMLVIDRQVVASARTIPQVVKSLDAIHIASAESFGESLDCVVTYDKVLTAVLRQRGVRVVTAAELTTDQEKS